VAEAEAEVFSVYNNPHNNQCNLDQFLHCRNIRHHKLVVAEV